MNILNKFTSKTLTKNKTRTIVTIIGIILSVAMFTAVTTSIVTLQKFMQNTAIATEGNWHGMYQSMSNQDADTLKQNKDVEATFSLQEIGYSKLENCKNYYKPYLYIGGMSDTFDKDMNINIISGRLPENSQEIILPSHLADNGGVRYSIGDTINLQIGDRKIDEEVLTQSNPYILEDDMPAETFVSKGTREYSVVGLYQRPNFEGYSSPGYTALTKSEDTTHPSTVYFRLHKPTKTYDFLENNFKFLGNQAHERFLMSLGISLDDGFNAALYSIGAILIVIIMFGSISLIYNSFSISVGERTRQFALLSSIGATKKQLKKSVIFEACMLSIIGIPLGILSGMIGMFITFKFIGKFFNIMVSSNANVALAFSCSVIALIIACILGFITVIISAYLPARRAIKINTIDAIRQTRDISIKSKKIRVSKLTTKLFGFEGLIATKNFKRNKKRYRATVLSLFMSIVLFISATTLSSYLAKSATDVVGDMSYDLAFNYVNHDKTTTGLSFEQTYDLLKSTSGVDQASFTKTFTNTQIEIDKSQISNEFLKYLNTDLGKNHMIFNGEKCLLNTIVYFVDDKTYENYLKENNYDLNKYINTQSPQALAVDTFKTKFDGKYYTYKILKSNKTETNLLSILDKEGLSFMNTSFSDDNQAQYNFYSSDGTHKTFSAQDATTSQTISIGDTISKLPLGVESNNSGISLIYPYSHAPTMFKDIESDNSMALSTIYFKASDHKTAYTNLSTSAEQIGLSSTRLQNFAQYAENNKALIIVLNVFSYGFIALISLISLANVFNTISTNISLRRREFAILKSMGMTKRGFNKMMNFECILYGAKSLIWGIPIGLIISYLIHISFENMIETGFMFPISSIIIAFLSVFIVVFSTMLYSMNKIKKDNPIEAIKNENL